MNFISNGILNRLKVKLITSCNRCRHTEVMEMYECWVEHFLSGVNPAHDFRPYIVDLWNKAKGSQDIVSRQLRNSKIDFNRLSPRAFLLIRQIMTQMLNTHLLYRLLQFQLNENIETYHTYKKLKIKLITMSSFSDFLWFFAEEWKPKGPSATTLDNTVTQQVSRVPKSNRLIWFIRKGKD